MGRFWYIDSSGRRKRTKAGLAHQYEKFESSTKAKKARASRNKARRQAIASGRVSKGDGKEIHHANGNPRDNSPSNLKVLRKSDNAGKREKSRRRNSRRNKRRWGR